MSTIYLVIVQVVEMTLVTPGEGTLTVTAESDPELFHVTRVRSAALCRIIRSSQGSGRHYHGLSDVTAAVDRQPVGLP